MADFPCVLRVAPVKEAAIRGAHLHQTRTGGPGASPSFDTSRRGLNRTLYGTGNVQADVAAVLGQYKKAHKDGTPCAEMILTADDEFFNSISPGWRNGVYTDQFKGWVRTNVEWLKRKYPGLASVTLHMDEHTPHLHVMVVPLSTYEQRYRRGSKTVTKVHYNKVFGDDAAIIAEARKTNNSELTKLGRLQTEYANVMRPFGLVRGVKNSRAHHRTVKQYHDAVNKPLADRPVKPSIQLPEKPALYVAMKAAGIDTAYDKALAELEMETSRYESDVASYQVQLESKAKEFDRMKDENKTLKQSLRIKDEQIAKLSEELTLSKEVIDRLRKSPLQGVAQALGYDGLLTNENGSPKWKGAIDMVKDVGGLDYKQAVAWLYHEFGANDAVLLSANEAVAVAREHVQEIEGRKEPRPYTKQEYAIRAELAKQLDALNADKYRVTLMHQDAGRSYNLGKARTPDTAERFFKRDELLDMVPKLNNENWRREYNVFITPFSDRYWYVLMDDMTPDSLAKMKADGHAFSVIQKTSTASIQGVMLLPKDAADKDVGNAVFRTLNLEYGDPNISGFVHPFRAVGFRNVKPKHRLSDGRFPVVTLLEAAHSACKRLAGLVRDVMMQTDLTAAQAVPEAVRKQSMQRLADVPPSAALDPTIAREAAQFYGWVVERYKGHSEKGADLSTADFMLAKRLHERGIAADQIKAAILQHSPNLLGRHRDTSYHVNRILSRFQSPEPAEQETEPDVDHTPKP
ncbi:MobV family relaxase [Azospirillum sp. BE72]|uniref:MobV family relaxase n=1 Tax=Azospirillum sp. BE72 TaxID=2817776 RepID=UPI002863987C|nr:MobV family relaxase [Azospirillum sp. BE72]MDR6775728.1 hypothetical protein [Azospirillum sp. BE72]